MSAGLLRAATVAAMVLVVGATLFAVRANERILSEGRVVLARLAPVDPRSLMQGDYMALRYAIDDELPGRYDGPDAMASAAYAYLKVDSEGRATLAGVGDHPPADPALVAMKVRQRNGQSSIGPNAFFFQEGRAQAFDGAQWGEFRVDIKGKALLTHLRDERLQRLGENRR